MTGRHAQRSAQETETGLDPVASRNEEKICQRQETARERHTGRRENRKPQKKICADRCLASRNKKQNEKQKWKNQNRTRLTNPGQEKCQAGKNLWHGGWIEPQTRARRLLRTATTKPKENAWVTRNSKRRQSIHRRLDATKMEN
jgi:hypothetical protein